MLPDQMQKMYEALGRQELAILDYRRLGTELQMLGKFNLALYERGLQGWQREEFDADILQYIKSTSPPLTFGLTAPPGGVPEILLQITTPAGGLPGGSRTLTPEDPCTQCRRHVLVVKR